MRKVVIIIVMILFFLPILGSYHCLPSDYDTHGEYLCDWKTGKPPWATLDTLRPLHMKLRFIPEPWRSTIFFAVYITFGYIIILLLKKNGYWDTKSIEETAIRNVASSPKVDKPKDEQKQ